MTYQILVALVRFDQADDRPDVPVVVREIGVDVLNEATGQVLLAGFEKELERGGLEVFETVEDALEPAPETE
jgi:hypothetical protein